MIELDTIIVFFQTYGYAAVFGMLLLCGLGLPVPEDISIVAGGVLSGLGFTDIRVMGVGVMASVLIGDGIIYFAGRYLGMKALEYRFTRALVNGPRFHAIQGWFGKYGRWVIFAGRFMPGFRSPIFLTTGILRVVPPGAFFAIDGFAALISVPVWLAVGYFGAHNRERLMEWMTQGHVAVGVLVGVIIVAIAIKMIIRRRLEADSAS